MLVMMRALYKLLLAVTLLVFPLMGLAEKTFMTVDDLVADGYKKLQGYEISALMDKHVIKVVDIETDAVVESKTDDSKQGLSRDFSEVKHDSAKSMLDTRLLARAPALDGTIERKVAADALVVTNGVRTYRYSVYKKAAKMYAVRDVDYGNVYFEVSVE